MDLRHLRYFQAVAEELNFSRAARKLRVAQPALSRAVMEIEAELGASVFERTKHYVRLTPAGEVLLHETGVLLERWEDSLRRVKRTAAGEEGELRLGYIGPPTQSFLGRVLAEYRKRYPLVSIHLEERTPERVWEMVAKGRLSVAMTRPVLSHESLGLRTVLLRKERLGVVVTSHHPLAKKRSIPWTALESQPLIVLARREGISLHDSVIASCRQAGFTPYLAETPSLIGTVLRYAEAGSGIGVVPDSVTVAEKSLTFVPLTPASYVELVLVWQEDLDPPQAKRFRELLIDWKNRGKLWG
ncbi:MAG: LysR family transcriptional regulator [Verrucomicrobiales bacterium]|nr:LysR family transcriptional regulator [Verrucomicrobiales bacterium]